MKLALEEYSSWLDTEVKKLVRPAVFKGGKLLDETRKNLKEARRFFEDLSRKADKDMATKRDPTSYRAARVIGHSAKEAAENLVGIQLPREVSWDSLKAARDSLSLANRALRESRNRAGAELAGLYILDMRSYGGFVDRISRASERLTRFLEGEGSSLQKARTLDDLVSNIQQTRKEIANQEDQRNALLNDSKLLADEIQRSESEREKLSYQTPLREILEIERGLRKESIEFRTVTLAHLQRPLRKLRDLSQRGEVQLGPEERTALEKSIVSPYRSFLSRQDGAYIVGILRSLHLAMRSGKMGFKSRKAARVTAHLDQLLGSDRLSEMQMRGRELLSRRWKILQDPSCRRLYQTRKELLSKIQETRHRREEILGRIDSLKEKTVAQSKRLEELVAIAETRTAEHLGRQVQILR